jgi:hypothetical protein
VRQERGRLEVVRALVHLQVHDADGPRQAADGHVQVHQHDSGASEGAHGRQAGGEDCADAAIGHRAGHRAHDADDTSVHDAVDHAVHDSVDDAVHDTFHHAVDHALHDAFDDAGSDPVADGRGRAAAAHAELT